MPMTEAEASDLFRAAPDRYVDADGGAAAVRTVGTGPDVLFVHGWPVSGATFRRLLPHLVDHVTCHVIDLPGAGSSRFGPNTPLTLAHHVDTIRAVVDTIAGDVAVVGGDSGGLLARHALAGDDRLRAMGLINTEQSSGLGWRFRSFLLAGRLPGFGAALGWLAGHPRLRRNKFVLGDAFIDRSLLDGDFDEFFLHPLHTEPERLDAAMRLLRSFDTSFVDELAQVHARIAAPVHLVWGVDDPFFPIEQTREMVDTFSNAHLTEITDAKLFVHEERPAQVAAALLPTLTGTT